jgi:hypothetical protein
MGLRVFAWTYVQSAGKWCGCDWPTAFGVHNLDLKGLRPSQATLLAGATAGSEAADWRAEAGRLTEALRLAEEACVIEGRYHTSLVWQPLLKAIATALAGD